MKKFTFPLDRVLSWRQTQARLEEATLARQAAELNAIDQRHNSIQQSLTAASAALLALPSATPVEIGALEHHRASASAQTRFLLQSRHALQQKSPSKPKPLWNGAATPNFSNAFASSASKPGRPPPPAKSNNWRKSPSWHASTAQLP